MTGGRVIFCGAVCHAPPDWLAERLGLTVELVGLSDARADPLAFQSHAASVGCVVSDPETDEEIRALCGDFADVIAVPRA